MRKCKTSRSSKNTKCITPGEVVCRSTFLTRSVTLNILKKVLAIIAVATLTTQVKAQQLTDVDIVNAVLGKSYHKLHNKLDCMKVWYHLHIQPNDRPKGYTKKPKVYSIADGDGTVKVWILRVDEKLLTHEIIVNFRHDSRDHVEDIGKVGAPTSYNNGTYSTDVSLL